MKSISDLMNEYTELTESIEFERGEIERLTISLDSQKENLKKVTNELVEALTSKQRDLDPSQKSVPTSICHLTWRK